MSKRISPEEALTHYFDELLTEELVVDELLLQTEVFSEPADALAAQLADAELERQQRLEKLLLSAKVPLVAEPKVVAEVVEEIQSWPIESSVVEASPIIDSAVSTCADTQVAVEQKVAHVVDAHAWLENGRPSWAQERFEVLLFQVSGLTLAVPLMSLGQIQPLTDELTPLFGQADWFMGLQPTPAGKIRTVNTAKFVMPERYDEKFVETAKYVVSINGVPWGLAVDSVNQPVTLNPEDVKWRGERSKRPWLAGTVKSHMCALLDINMIGETLMQADKNARGYRQPE